MNLEHRDQVMSATRGSLSDATVICTPPESQYLPNGPRYNGFYQGTNVASSLRRNKVIAQVPVEAGLSLVGEESDEHADYIEED